MSNVKLISTSSPNILYDIAYMARVSNPSNQNNTDTNEKLIRYLIKHKHWSPFEMASVALEINTTRDIAHQIVRHRSFAFQEFSQRYADPSALDSWPFELRIINSLVFTSPKQTNYYLCLRQDNRRVLNQH